MGFGLRNRTSLPTNMSGVVIPEGSGSHINISVKSFGVGDGVFFRMKRSSPLSKLINAYCELKGILGMGNGDEIGFFWEMMGRWLLKKLQIVKKIQGTVLW
ncbi:hypothetical protein MKX03_003969 [Papaver bracteatum]|nr:hypothetical protein MKX03_003969 [Papaver bracteatum]